MTNVTIHDGSSLASVFSENASPSQAVLMFLDKVSKKNPYFMALFDDGCGAAAERETIIFQMVRGIVNTGKSYNGLGLAGDRGCGLVQNGRALEILENSGYVSVNDERNKITLTDKMILKLASYYSTEFLGQSASTNAMISGAKDQPLLLGQ